MVSMDPNIYNGGLYNLDEEILNNIDQYIGIPFQNETNNKRYNVLEGMIFGGPAKKPYIYFLRDIKSKELISWPDDKKLKVGDIFARQDHIKKVILDIKSVNIYYGHLAKFNFDIKDFYLRFEGITTLLEKVLRGNYNSLTN